MTFLMEFNYLSLPRGDLARKRPTARGRREGGQDGGAGRRRVGGGGSGRGEEGGGGGGSFPPVVGNWITSVLIWKDVSQSARRGGRDWPSPRLPETTGIIGAMSRESVALIRSVSLPRPSQRLSCIQLCTDPPVLFPSLFPEVRESFDSSLYSLYAFKTLSPCIYL